MGSRAVFLMELTFGGRSWRFATEPTTQTIDGASLRFDDPFSLLGGVTLEFPIFREAGALDRAQVAFHFPERFDYLDAIAEGHVLYLAPATIWIMLPGGQPSKLLSGTVQDYQRGLRDAPIEATIYADRRRSPETLPPASAVVDGSTFQYAPSVVYGTPYPLVFGSPGPYTKGDGTVAGNSGSKGVLIDPGVGPSTRAPKLLLSYSHCGATSDTVNIFNQGIFDAGTLSRAASVGTATILNGTDDLGQKICYCALHYAGTGTALDVGSETDPYLDWYINWDGTLGAHDVDDSSIETADQLIAHLLQQSGEAVDYRRMEAIKPIARQYRFAGAIEDPADGALVFLRESILPLMPATLVAGPEGYYVSMWSPDAPAVASLTEGREVHRTDDPTVSERLPDQPATRWEMRYAPRRFNGVYQRTQIYTGNPDHGIVTSDTLSVEVHAPMLSAYYQILRGGRIPDLAPEPIKSDWVYDETTAALCLSWRASAYARPWESQVYEADYDLVGFLERGDMVTLTDPGRGWSEVKAIVGRITYDITGISMVLQTNGRT